VEPRSLDGWCRDGIAPTFQVGDTFGWLIDGRIEIATDEPGPIVAWTEFVGRNSRTMLATFHMWENSSTAHFRVWKLAAGGGATSTAEDIDRSMTRHFVTSTQHPVLQALIHEHAEQEAQRDKAIAQRRAADPLIQKMDELKDIATFRSHEPDLAMTNLHELAAALPRADVDELLVRLALDYDEVSERLYELENQDDDSAFGN